MNKRQGIKSVQNKDGFKVEGRGEKREARPHGREVGDPVR